MRLAILLVFVAMPLLEIALLVKLGEVIHFWPTLAIVIGTAIIGTTIMRQQGLKALMNAQRSMAEGKLPVDSVIDGSFLLIAGAFLLTPGLITDTIGFIFLVPPFRRQLARWGFKKFTEGGDGISATLWQGSTDGAAEDRQFGDARGGGKTADSPEERRSQPQADNKKSFEEGPIIEGDFHRLDDKPPENGKR